MCIRDSTRRGPVHPQAVGPVSYTHLDVYKRQVYTPTKEERDAFKKAMTPVHTKMADRVGKETLQMFYKETGFTPN